MNIKKIETRVKKKLRPKGLESTSSESIGSEHVTNCFPEMIIAMAAMFPRESKKVAGLAGVRVEGNCGLVENIANFHFDTSGSGRIARVITDGKNITEAFCGYGDMGPFYKFDIKLYEVVNGQKTITILQNCFITGIVMNRDTEIATFAYDVAHHSVLPMVEQPDRIDIMKKLGLKPWHQFAIDVAEKNPTEEVLFEGRQTGRTTKAIVDALFNAGIGNKVLIVAHSGTMAEIIKNKLKDAQKMLPSIDLKLVNVISVDEMVEERGRRYDKVIVDHYAKDMLLKTLLVNFFQRRYIESRRSDEMHRL